MKKNEIENLTMFDKLILENVEKEDQTSFEIISMITAKATAKMNAEQVYNLARPAILSKFKQELKEKGGATHDN